MPLTDDKISDMDSSSASETLDVAVDTALAADPANATSSDANGATDDSTLSIVRDVVDESRPEKAAASPADGQEAGQETDGAATTKKELDDENFSDVPFNKHPRFRQLIQQRDSLKADATRYQNVQSFMDDNSITAEEAADAFIILGLMRSDPTAAWVKLKPIVQELLQAAGEVLPDDLVDLVKAGKMSQEAAFEVSRSRAQVQTVRTNQSYEEQREERRRQQAHASSLYTTAQTWQADRETKDPNFAAKLIPLKKELAFIQMNEGKPSTPEGVKDQLKRAYAAVSVPVTAAAPVRRVAVRAPNPAATQSNARQAPETTLDIIRAARGRA